MQWTTQKDAIIAFLCGHWVEWDPDPDEIGNQEYGNPELNQMFKTQKENKKPDHNLKSQKHESHDQSEIDNSETNERDYENDRRILNIYI